MKTLNP